MLERNQCCSLSLDIINPSEGGKIYLDVISLVTGHSSVKMIPGIVHMLLKCNNPRGLSEC